jgi:hypothetical protein
MVLPPAQQPLTHPNFEVVEMMTNNSHNGHNGHYCWTCDRSATSHSDGTLATLSYLLELTLQTLPDDSMVRHPYHSAPGVHSNK